jgi:putative ABC transport system ATP-binding protein
VLTIRNRPSAVSPTARSGSDAAGSADTTLPAARAVDATKVYGSGDSAVVALDHVSIDFDAGRFTAIMGPSGSGKSTLMHSVAGLDDLTSGQVFIGDTDLTTLKDRALTALRRDRIGFVFQAFNLVPTLTALENITLPASLAGRRTDTAWLHEVIDTVGLRPRLSHRPSELSGGQQQRVAVARALAGQPEIVVADQGSGIPAADRERALRRFVRLDPSRGTPGAGLGLALVAAVARMHGASLELGDNAPGLRVTLRFPPAPAAPPPEPGTAAATARSTA